MKEVIKALESITANTYALAVKTQNYHWNVTGPHFKPLHELFGAQYEEMSLAIDELAERIRMLGSKVEASFEAFAKLSVIKNGNKNLTSEKMVKDLADSQKALTLMLKNGIEIAQKNGDEATADILITRLEAHDKMGWMLLASL